MGIFVKESSVDRLLNLLSMESEALTNGTLDDLVETFADKELALEDLYADKDSISDANIRAIKNKFSDNQRLYSAVQAGLSAAHSRLSTLREPNAYLTTYDASGQRCRVSSASREVKL